MSDEELEINRLQDLIGKYVRHVEAIRGNDALNEISLEITGEEVMELRDYAVR